MRRRQCLDFDYAGRSLGCAGMVALLVLLVLFGASCAEGKAPRGSAQDIAAGAAARAESNARAADEAAVDAARKTAVATALEQAAKAQPTEARIAAAVAARIDASAARAVADALEGQRVKANDEADQAAVKARLERTANDKAAADASWLFLCRCLGLAGVALGGLLGGLLGWLAGPRVGAPLGGLIAGTGLLVVAYGATVTWLPIVLAIAVVVGVVSWAVYHRRSLVVGVALSKTVDAIQGQANVTAAAAKEALGDVLEKTGMQARFDRLRSEWKPPERIASPPASVTPP